MESETGLPMQGQLAPQAVEHAEHPRHYGPLADFNGHARVTGPCGDTMDLWLRIADGRIAAIGFTTTGCGPSRAAGSMAAEMALGKPVREARDLGQADILGALGGLPEESEHCALLAADTLKAALRDFAERKGCGAEPCGGCSSGQGAASAPRPPETDEALRHRQALEGQMGRIKFKLLVLSGKGGVGKSTVAANLAVSLALAGKSVGLLDVDIHGPSVPRLMGLEGTRPVAHDGRMAPLELGENLKVMSIGFLLESGRDAVIWRGPMKYGVIRQFLSDVDWGTLDCLVVDAPPGTGDEPLSVAQLVGQPAGAILVTTPQQLSVADVRRSASFCEKLSLPVLGIVENMSGMVCPHCGKRIEVFKTGGGEGLAAELGLPLWGRVPIDPQIVDCGDSGVPYIHRFAASEAAKVLAEIARRVEQAARGQPAS